jgi:type II secretory pathway pseudopilin PulG
MPRKGMTWIRVAQSGQRHYLQKGFFPIMYMENLNNKSQSGLTAIETIFLLAIIFVLGALLLSNSSDVPRRAMIAKAQTQMSHICAAILQYEAAYGRLPVGNAETNTDVTYGLAPADIQGIQAIEGTRLVSSNSDIMVILLNLDQGVNNGRKLNPKQTTFLDAKIFDDTIGGAVSGVDYQFRDPWGHPYVISLDGNNDGFVRDAVYANPAVSSYRSSNQTNRQGFYELKGRCMVWSRGPDGKVSMRIPANEGVNKDNIVN